MTGAVLQITGLGVDYHHEGKSIPAVDDLSFHLAEGEFLSVVGPSGSGKTTLLRTILGLLVPARGEVAYDGQKVTGVPPGVAAVFQEYNRSLFPWLSVEKNIAFGLQGLSREESRSRVSEVLELVRLPHVADKYPWQLSGGMQQRVAIARSLALQPRILLMDEPFASVDAQTRLYLEEMLLDLWQRLKFSVLFVTHDIDEAVFMSDRVLVLSSSPARVLAELTIHLARPRNQVETKADAAFHGVRAKILRLIQPEGVAAVG